MENQFIFNVSYKDGEYTANFKGKKNEILDALQVVFEALATDELKKSECPKQATLEMMDTIDNILAVAVAKAIVRNCNKN